MCRAQQRVSCLIFSFQNSDTKEIIVLAILREQRNKHADPFNVLERNINTTGKHHDTFYS